MINYYIIVKLVNFFKFLFLFKKKIFQIFHLLIFVIKNSDYGKYTEDVYLFEDKVRHIFNSKYSLTFSSATSAFDSILSCLNLDNKSKILSTDLIFNTFFLNSLYHKLQFEILETDNNFDIIKKDLFFNDIKLIIITHPFGIIKEFKILRDFAKKNDIPIIEDCSHALGAKINSKDIGFKSTFRVFSIGGKMISGGEGGVVLTDNYNYYSKLNSLSHPYRDIFQEKNKDNFYLKFSSPKKNRINPINVILAKFDLNKLSYRNIKINRNIDQFMKLIMTSSKYNNLISFISKPHEIEYGGFYYGFPIYIKDKNLLLKLSSYKDIFFKFPWLKIGELKQIKLIENEFQYNMKKKDYSNKENYLFINYKYLEFNPNLLAKFIIKLLDDH